MAERCDRVEYTEEDILELIKNYGDRLAEAKILERRDEEAEFLKRCLEFLDKGDSDILMKTYSEGISVRRYSRYSGLSRFLISKHREKSVKLITKLFNLKFF